ncbi:MAG: hydroxyethylthiazole kinase, partial [Bacillales bacterium]
PLLARVTGTGWLLSAVVGAFAAVGDERLEASVSALVFYGVAAERAAEKTRALGTGSFQIEFLNQLSLLRGEEIMKYCAFEKL